MGTHLIDGEFQSDKYPTTPRGKVPLSVKDPTAQDLLWVYAQRRRKVDADFSADLEIALIAAGFIPPAQRNEPLELLEADVDSAPRRVQLSRRKGWRMPENTVKVDRSTDFGNPYQAGEEGSGKRDYLVTLFRQWLDREGQGSEIAERARQELRGKNLACWCPLDGPCHADVLLEIANR